jgi:sugar phosphate isomerase/epimerase
MQPHQLISPLRDLLWIRKETEEEHIAACFDTGHAAITGNLPLVLRELSGHITIVHAHDNHGGGDDHLLPGEGGIDWPKLIHELLTSGFQGPFIIELNDTPEVRPATVIEGAIRARNYLERIIAEQVPTLSDRATY